jgi:2'-hydroxyisoflavone reductase
MMKILILGGTSFLGYHTVQAAIDRGHEVTLFNRGKTGAKIFGDAVEYLVGDRDPGDPSASGGLAALEGTREWDAVLDVNGYLPRLVKASVELLADRCAAYLYVSTISVYANPLPKGLTEDAPHTTMDDPTDEEIMANYGALKSLCETEVRNRLAQKATFVRPGIIAGPRDYTDRFTYWVHAAATQTELLCPGVPEDPFQAIDARDLGTWMIHLLETDTRGTFNACAPSNSSTVGEMIEACIEGTHSAAKPTWLPWDFLEQNEISAWLDLPLCLPPGHEIGEIRTVDSSLAYRAGLKIRPLAQTVRDTWTWLQDDLKTRPKPELRTGMNPEKAGRVVGEWLAKSSV